MHLVQLYDTGHVWMVPPSPDSQAGNLVGVSSEAVLSALTRSPVVNLKLVTINKVPLRMSIIDLHMTALWRQAPRCWIVRGDLTVQWIAPSVFFMQISCIVSCHGRVIFLQMFQTISLCNSFKPSHDYLYKISTQKWCIKKYLIIYLHNFLFLFSQYKEVLSRPHLMGACVMKKSSTFP